MNKKSSFFTAKQWGIVTLIFFSFFSQFACSRPQAKAEPVTAAYFNVVERPLSEDYVNDFLILENKIVALFIDYTSESFDVSAPLTHNMSGAAELFAPMDSASNPFYLTSRLSLYDFDGLLLNSLDLDAILGPTEHLRFLVENPAGGFCVFSIFVDFFTSDVTYQLAFFTDNGRKTKTIFLHPKEYIAHVCSLSLSTDGKICLVGWGIDYADCAYLFTHDGRLIHKIEAEEPLTSPDVLHINGIFYLHASVFRENQYQEALFQIDSASGKIDSPTLLPMEYPVGGNVFVYQNTCCAFDGQKLVEYNLETQTLRPLVRWHETEISISVDAIRILPEQKILCVGYSPVFGMTVISTLTGTDQDPLANQKRIVLAGFRLDDEHDLRLLIQRFNRSHPEHQIILRDYRDEISEDISWEQIVEELRRITVSDFLLGNAPDIYFDAALTMSLVEYSSKNELIDLTPFLVAETSITDENYLMNVLLGAQTQGHVYFIPTCFTINCFSAPPDLIQGRSSLSFEEFDRIMAGFPPGTPAQSYFSKTDLLGWVFISSIHEYVDFAHFRANFLNPSFISLLEWVNRYGIDEKTDFANAAFDFEYLSSLWGVLSTYEWSGVFHEYIGFPGNASDQLGFVPRNIFAISSTCKDPGACWDLIADALSEDFQTRSYPYDILVNRKAIQARIDEIQADIENNSPYSFTADEVAYASEIYWDLLERAGCMFTLSGSVEAIVWEEAEAYFAGYKSAEDVAAVIQNRVQNMLNERK